MSRATITLEARPDRGRGVHRVVIECEHAVTVGWLVPGDRAAPPLRVVAGSLVQLHHKREGCACTRTLRERYGLSLDLPASSR